MKTGNSFHYSTRFIILPFSLYMLVAFIYNAHLVWALSSFLKRMTVSSLFVFDIPLNFVADLELVS